MPIAAVLRRHLAEQRLARGEKGNLFSAATVSGPSPTRRPASEPYDTGRGKAKALSAFMGHASITMTLDRYGRLFPGSEEDAAGLLDAYLERSIKAARE